MAVEEQLNQAAGVGQQRRTAAALAAEIDRLIARCQDLRNGDAEQALALAEEALALAEAEGDEARAAACSFESGVCRSRLARYDSAQEHLSRALTAGNRTHGASFEARCLKELGLIHHIRAEYLQALGLLTQSLALYQGLGDTSGTSKLLDNVGCVYYELGDYATALGYLLDSLRMDEESGDETGLGHSLYNIANVYVSLGDFDNASDFLRRSLALSRLAGNVEIESVALCLSGEVAVRQRRYAEALAASRDALALADAPVSTAPYVERLALTLRGQALQGLGHWSKAASCFERALGRTRRDGDRRQESILLRSLAAVRDGQGRRAEALRHMEAALAVAEAVGAKQDVCEAHRGLAAFAKGDGDFARALGHTEAFHAAERAVLSDAADRRAQVLMIQMKVESAQKEAELHRQEAELHRLRSVELAQLNADLAEADAQKAGLIAKLQEQAELLQAQAEELQAQAGELERQAAHDALTGLLNRRSLEERLSRAHAHARRHGEPLVVAMADVDHFKGINDRFGHQTGDAVLRAVAALLQRGCRAGDLVARYGGEEFVLIMPQTDAAQARMTCERLRRAVEAHSWHTLQPGLSVTLTLGLAQDASAPHHERVLALADAQLYQAKAAGRNRTHSASE